MSLVNKIKEFFKLLPETLFNVFLPTTPKLIRQRIRANCVNGRKRIIEVNQIRNLNLITVVWSNAGSLFGVIVTIFATVVYPLVMLVFEPKEELYAYIFLTEYFNWSTKTMTNVLWTGYFALIILFFRALIWAIDNVLKNLPPKQYAEISLNNRNQSKIVTFVSYKMWETTFKFLKNTGKSFYDLSNFVLQDTDGSHINENIVKDENQKISDQIKLIQKNSRKYQRDFYNNFYKLIELQRLACVNLNIHEREFSHHILRFSPSIFNERLKTFALSLDTLVYATSRNEGAYKEELLTLFDNHFFEMKRIVDDINKRMENDLLQLICYNKIHKSLIGLSAVNSTSRSLNIFMRAISSTIERGNKRQKKKEDTSHVFHKQTVGEIKAILHRSKAHYGIDILVTLENLYRKNVSALEKNSSKNKDIPAVLYQLKYKNGIDGVGDNGDKSVAAYIKDTNEEKHIEKLVEYMPQLMNMREILIKIHQDNSKKINAKFNTEIKKLKKTEKRKILCVFGYSRIVRNALKESFKELNDDKILIFLFKEQHVHMLDTRIFRLELSDDPFQKVRNTFTASDEFLLSLIRKEDDLIFIGGAEAYIRSHKLVVHTNSYQKRMVTVLKRIEDEKMKYSVWIVANDYKVFDEFPPPTHFFRKEIFSDHYDDVDLYDFSARKGNVKLISTGKATS